jgi:hypothetical protein
VLENTARLADDVTELEHDRLQMGRDPREARSLHRGEQAVVHLITWLTFGHNGFFKTLVKTEHGARRCCDE